MITTTGFLTRAVAVGLAATLLLAGCGGDSEPNDGAAEGGTGGTPSGSGSAAGSGSQDGSSVGFDAAALSTDPLDVAQLRIAQRGSSVAPPVDPVIDTCAALSAADLDVIANNAAERYSFGGKHTFVAESVGAACRYTSDTHAISVVVGSADEVNVDSAFVLPAASGDVSESPWADDASITILSEDSFGLDTPFAAFATAGTYGVAVSNGGGTGIDYSSQGFLFAEVAAAVAAGTDGAPAPADGAQAGAISGDPCTAWSVDELDAFLTDASIDSNDAVTTSNGCVWTAEDGGAEVAINLLDVAEAAALSLVPVAPGSAVLNEGSGGRRVYVVTEDAALRLTVRVTDRATLSALDSSDAMIALAENLVVRIGG